MTTQIAVVLPDAIIEFIDAEVGGGHSPSRTAFILQALEREHRRRVGAREALARTAPEADDSESNGYIGYRSVLWSDPTRRFGR